MDSQCTHHPDRMISLSHCCCLALAFCLSLAGAVSAQTIDQIQAAYSEGRFIDAARGGEALGTSQGLALAAGSLAIYSHYIAKDGEKTALLERAVELAREAIHSDPVNADAHLQLAHAIGRQAQTVGSLQAANRGYAEKIREVTERALQINPELVSAHLVLGRWHAELVDAMGPLMARIIYKARKRDAIASFERALELTPHAKVPTLEYAFGLLTLNDDKYREKARELLKRAIDIPPMDAYERILHDRAIERLTALDAVGN